MQITPKEYLNKVLSNKAFVSFLRKHKCLSAFKYNTLKNTPHKMPRSIIYYIDYAFDWEYTPQKFEYWNKLDKLWGGSIKKVCKLKKK